MAASFALRLDTTPPAVTWGYQPTLKHNEAYVLPYTITEPEIIEAVLEDAAGTRWALHVGPSSIWFSTGNDVALGPAKIITRTRDDVLNERTQVLVVEVAAPGMVIFYKDHAPVEMKATHGTPHVLSAEDDGDDHKIVVGDHPTAEWKQSDRPAVTIRVRPSAAVTMTVSTRAVD